MQNTKSDSYYKSQVFQRIGKPTKKCVKPLKWTLCKICLNCFFVEWRSKVFCQIMRCRWSRSALFLLLKDFLRLISQKVKSFIPSFMWKETKNNLEEIQNKSSFLKIHRPFLRSVADNITKWWRLACIKILYQQNTYTRCLISYWDKDNCI